MITLEVNTFLVVRVKTGGIYKPESETFHDYADRVADLLCSDPGAWMIPQIGGQLGDGRIVDVQFADEISNVLVEQFNGQDRTERHLFDDRLEPVPYNGCGPARYLQALAQRDALVLEVSRLLNDPSVTLSPEQTTRLRLSLDAASGAPYAHPPIHQET